MPPGRAYSAGTFILELDGIDVGVPASAEGGEAFAEVVEQPGVGGIVGKQLGRVRFAPIVVEVGASMADSFYDWVAAMLDGTQKMKNGAVVQLDHAMKERSRLEWASALITEIGFPAADASSKETVRLRVTLQPETTRSIAGSGALRANPSAARRDKALVASNFRFVVSGMGAGGTKVSKAAPFVVRRVAADTAIAPQREVVESTGVLDVANLVVWLAESDAAPFASWFEDFVISGHHDSAHERTASLMFLDPPLTSDLIGLEFSGVGIFRVSRERQDSDATGMARVKVEMYCESVRLAGPGGSRPALATTAPPTS